MSSLIGHLIRPVLHLTTFMQRFATIEGVRRASAWSEHASWLPRGVRSESVKVGGFTHEWLIPEDAHPDVVIFHIHGGGFVFPLYSPLKRTIGYLSKIARIRVFAVRYRLAPEHPFPAAVEDCAATFRWLVTEGGVLPERAVFTGESAGGCLAITTALLLREKDDQGRTAQ